MINEPLIDYSLEIISKKLILIINYLNENETLKNEIKIIFRKLYILSLQFGFYQEIKKMKQTGLLKRKLLITIEYNYITIIKKLIKNVTLIKEDCNENVNLKLFNSVNFQTFNFNLLQYILKKYFKTNEEKPFKQKYYDYISFLYNNVENKGKIFKFLIDKFDKFTETKIYLNKMNSLLECLKNEDQIELMIGTYDYFLFKIRKNILDDNSLIFLNNKNLNYIQVFL